MAPSQEEGKEPHLEGVRNLKEIIGMATIIQSLENGGIEKVKKILVVGILIVNKRAKEAYEAWVELGKPNVK